MTKTHTGSFGVAHRSIANWVNQTDLRSTALWGKWSEDCSTAR